MKNLLFIFMISSFLFSCDNNEIYSSEKKMEGEFWLFSDPFSGSFEITDTAKAYNIFLDITHQEKYAFQNIYLRITDDYSGNMTTDTVNINLMDQYGIWVGNGISGNKSFKVPLRKNLKFKEKKSYNYKIEQFSRNDTLHGISKVILSVRNQI